jgi:carbonic anhydrase/acetyltransferase-like protein (isoleucine patch superfamily)
VLDGGVSVGSHCDIRANASVRANTAIGDYVFIGERVQVGNSRTGGLDDPLWIKSYSYIGPGSAVHATKVDAEVYYGANVTSDYGTAVGEGSILTSGASMRHDERIRDHMVFQGILGLMEEPYRTHSKPGISEQQIMDLLGFHPKKWLVEVMGPGLEKPETYEAPLKDWDHVNNGTVKGSVRPGATLVGNVNIGENTIVAPGAYLEGNITIGRRCVAQINVMVVSKDAVIGDFTNMYDLAMVVDGRPARTAGTSNTAPDQVRIGAFSWINHLAALQGTSTGEFSIVNIGATAAYGTKVEREALLLNNSATYADQQLPARSISYGAPVQIRLVNSTMREREWFFYGKNYPNWERQATPEELKAYKLPQE